MGDPRIPLIELLLSEGLKLAPAAIKLIAGLIKSLAGKSEDEIVGDALSRDEAVIAWAKEHMK